MKTPRETKQAGQRVGLRLYVVNHTAPCLSALRNAQKLCQQQLPEWRLEVIDLSKNPQRAHDDEIVAIPTLVRHYPRPARRVIGDLSKTARVLAGLDLDAREEG